MMELQQVFENYQRIVRSPRDDLQQMQLEEPQEVEEEQHTQTNSEIFAEMFRPELEQM